MLLALHSRRVVVSRGKQHAAPTAARQKCGSLLRRLTLGGRSHVSGRLHPHGNRGGIVWTAVRRKLRSGPRKQLTLG